MSMKFAAVAAALLCALLVGAPRLMAHEGHDHETAAPVASNNFPRAEAASSAFELVAIKQGAELETWLDRFETNEPVRDAIIDVETPAGPATAVKAPNGSYRIPAAWASAPGRYDLIFTVTDGGNVDVLTATLVVPVTSSRKTEPLLGPNQGSLLGGVSTMAVAVASLLFGAFSALAFRKRPILWAPAIAAFLVIAVGAVRLLAHEGHDHPDEAKGSPAAKGDRSQILPDGSIFMPKPTQRVLAVRTTVNREEEHKRTVELPGRIIPDPNKSGLVQAAAAGRLSAPPAGFPSLGARVEAGDVLAYVTTPFLALDQPTLRQQAGDLAQQISIVERRVARYETLVKSAAIAQVTLDDARLELQGLKARRATVDTVKRDPEALVAPVGGVIAAANAVAGQIADPNAVLFQIVDPAHLWVEALSFNPMPASLKASARTSEGRSLSLDFIGAGFADRNQAAPVNFSIRDPAGLRLGQFVSVFAETSEATAGLALPRASVVRRSNGENVVYEHVGAERFEARIVRTQPLDGDNVLVIDGLSAGRRVVTQAAELLNQVR
ncbi:Multidrug efflux pump subunit AcrA (Membrane-fusion protein) [Methylocella tundrae]|uniref:Multidrug efflux pump subunit AcrA (Membrane-fusion protein) n=1 Tax=Methylocella tundrae TaxID=227605 RepID=A0A8B6M864_METTU|nr:HlyD family efflux transporter periplasmic adaptor subunit [Methylocella tundrae]VTZ50661.1 Multidrug efflux pump subunit AcrA (Membrane-fusion protein) [Methylocella tundrae]